MEESGRVIHCPSGTAKPAHHCTATALPPHVIVFLLPHGPSPLHDAVGRYAEGRWSDGAGVSVGVAKSWTIGDGAMSAVVSASVAVVMVMEISMIMMLTIPMDSIAMGASPMINNTQQLRWCLAIHRSITDRLLVCGVLGGQGPPSAAGASSLGEPGTAAGYRVSSCCLSCSWSWSCAQGVLAGSPPLRAHMWLPFGSSWFGWAGSADAACFGRACACHAARQLRRPAADPRSGCRGRHVLPDRREVRRCQAQWQ